MYVWKHKSNTIGNKITLLLLVYYVVEVLCKSWSDDIQSKADILAGRRVSWDSPVVDDQLRSARDADDSYNKPLYDYILDI